MAEFQLIVPYKPVQTKVALVGVVLMLPIWSLFAPGLLFAFVAWQFRNPGGLPLWIAVPICLFLLALWIGGCALSALSEDDKIHVSKIGFSFPPFLLSKLRLRRTWLWSELRSATIVDGTRSKVLVLGLEGGLTLPLDIRYFKATKLEELLLAIELWGINCERSPDLIEFQRETQNQNKGLQAHGYTKMWQEELGRRFTATTFVPLEPGRTLQNGKLTVVRQLAFGGLSAIYLVQREETQMFVLKEAVVPPNADPEARANAEQHLAREAQMLFCLFHPNIARVLDHFVEEGRHYLLMEYIHGQDLRQYVKQNGPCSQQQVVQWAIEVAGILKFLHEQNPAIVHRDLTPDNLVLKNDGQIVVIDFGASNEFVGTATGTLVGKQAYIAPEQLRGKTVPQSDLYALGGTMHFLLTGRDPIPLAQADIKAILPDISVDMEALVKSLTAFERKDRMTSAAEFLALLETMQATKDPGESSAPALSVAGDGE